MPRHFASTAAIFAALILFYAGTAPVRAVMLSPGDIVVGVRVPGEGGALFRINPMTGDRTVITSSDVGSGLNLQVSDGICLDTDGTLLISNSGDFGVGRVMRVDPLTGNRTVVSASNGSPVVGTGPSIVEPHWMDIDAQNRILLATKDGVLRIDPLTGNRTLLSGVGAGNGPAFGDTVVGIDQESDGTILVSTLSRNVGAVLRVDPNTGDRSILSDATHGSGPAYLQASIVLQGNSIFATTLIPDIALIETSTGDRTTVSGNTVGVGPSLGLSYGIAIDANGQLLVSTTSSLIIRVDPITGNRTIVSDNGVGTGPTFFESYGIFVVPSVPEPSSIVLVCAGMIGLALVGYRQRAMLRACG